MVDPKKYGIVIGNAKIAIIAYFERTLYAKYILIVFLMFCLFLSYLHNNKAIVTGLFALITCLSFFLLREKSTLSKWAIYFLLFSISFGFFSAQVFYRLGHPAIWDYTAYYLYGKVASEGLDFYLPDNYQLVFDTLKLPFSSYEGLIEEVVNVGCPYPPPTILYLLPLGYMPYNVGLIYWTLFHLVFAFGCIFLLYSLFLKSYKLDGLFLTATLFCLMPPVKTTIFCSQTNFLVLFLLLLIYKYSDKKISGAFLSIAVFTKPYMLIYGLYFLLSKRWSVITSAIVTSIFILIITYIFIGKEPFISYLFNIPISRAPAYVFSEEINQSLHAVLLRQNMITLSSPMEYLLIVSGILLATFLLLLYLVKLRLFHVMFMILLLVALLIYPGTLSHYGTVLLFVIFSFLSNKEEVRIGAFYAVPIIAIFYFLSKVSVFSSVAFLIFVIVAKTFISKNGASKFQMLHIV